MNDITSEQIKNSAFEGLIDRYCKVTLNFSLSMLDGQVIDSNFEQAPVSFSMGDGNLLTGFENKLLGLAEGDEKTFEISSQDAFGEHNEDNIQRFGIDQFTNEDELEIGLVITFNDAANGEVPGVVIAIGEEKIDVDFNHPLAGKNLLFKVKIHQITMTAR